MILCFSDLGKLRRVTGFLARSRSWTAALMCGPQRASYRRVGFRSQPRWTSTPGQNSRSCGTTSPRLARHPDQCWGPLARRPEDTSWAPARTSRPTARSSWVSIGGVVEVGRGIRAVDGTAFACCVQVINRKPTGPNWHGALVGRQQCPTAAPTDYVSSSRSRHASMPGSTLC